MNNTNIYNHLLKQNKNIENYIVLHENTSKYYITVHTVINILNILLSGISAVFSTVLSQVESLDIKNQLYILFASILYTSSVLTSFSHFLQYEKLAQDHITKANAYNSLRLSFNNKKIDELNEEYFLWITKSYDELLTSLPSVNKMPQNIDLTLNSTVIDTTIDIKTNISLEEEKYQIDRYMLNSG